MVFSTLFDLNSSDEDDNAASTHSDEDVNDNETVKDDAGAVGAAENAVEEAQQSQPTTESSTVAVSAPANLTRGCVIWAKMATYPWWPATVRCSPKITWLASEHA